MLLARGANPRLLAPGSRSSLYVAAEHGSLRCVEALLRSGDLGVSDVFQASTRLTTPLSVARRRGHVAVAELLHTFVESAGGAVAQEDAVPKLRRSRSAGAGGSGESLRVGEAELCPSSSSRASRPISGRPVSSLVRCLSLPKHAQAALPQSAAPDTSGLAGFAAGSPSPQRRRPQSARAAAATPRTPRDEHVQENWQQRQQWRQERLGLRQRQEAAGQVHPRPRTGETAEPQHRQRAVAIASGGSRGDGSLLARQPRDSPQARARQQLPEGKDGRHASSGRTPRWTPRPPRPPSAQAALGGA